LLSLIIASISLIFYNNEALTGLTINLFNIFNAANLLVDEVEEIKIPRTEITLDNSLLETFLRSHNVLQASNTTASEDLLI
jgi:hypothetical protein